MVSQTKPIIILRQLSNDSVSQCHFISQGESDSCTSILASSKNQISIFDLKTRRIKLKIFTSHSSTILSCGILQEERQQLGSDEILQSRFIASWARDGHVELHEIDWREMKHVCCLHRLLIGKVASFCKWALDVGGGETPAIFLPHSNEKDVLKLILREGHLVISDTFLCRRDGQSDDDSASDDEVSPDTEGTILNKKARGMLMSLAVNSRYLCIAWESGLISVLDKHRPEHGALFEFKTVEKDPKEFPQPITEIHTFGDEYLAVGSSSSVVNIFRLDDQTLVKQYDLPHKSGINHFSNDGHRFLVAAGWDHRIRIYDMKRHKALGVLKFHTDTVNCVCVLQHGHLDLGEGEGMISNAEKKGRNLVICSGGSDRRIAVWNIQFEAKSGAR